MPRKQTRKSSRLMSEGGWDRPTLVFGLISALTA